MPYPTRTADTMSDAIAIASPNGRMSKAALARAQARLGEALFGAEGLQQAEPKQEERKAALLRQATELRDLADRGMRPRAHRNQAARLEAEAANLEETRHVYP